MPPPRHPVLTRDTVTGGLTPTASLDSEFPQLLCVMHSPSYGCGFSGKVFPLFLGLSTFIRTKVPVASWMAWEKTPSPSSQVRTCPRTWRTTSPMTSWPAWPITCRWLGQVTVPETGTPHYCRIVLLTYIVSSPGHTRASPPSLTNLKCSRQYSKPCSRIKVIRFVTKEAASPRHTTSLHSRTLRLDGSLVRMGSS